MGFTFLLVKVFFNRVSYCFQEVNFFDGLFSYFHFSDKPILVDRECSPLPFTGQCLSVGDITSDKLTDLCASEDGSRQLALLLIKQEVRNDRSNDRRVNVHSFWLSCPSFPPPPFLFCISNKVHTDFMFFVFSLKRLNVTAMHRDIFY